MPLHCVWELLALTAVSFFSVGVACEAHRTLKSGDIHNVFAEDDYDIRRTVAGCSAVFLLVIVLGVGYLYGLFGV